MIGARTLNRFRGAMSWVILRQRQAQGSGDAPPRALTREQRKAIETWRQEHPRKDRRQDDRSNGDGDERRHHCAVPDGGDSE